MSALKRTINPMPPFVEQALEKHDLRGAFEARPDYQRNDWLGWIARAKKEDTQMRRLEKMLAELKAGHGYMGMAWEPKR